MISRVRFTARVLLVTSMCVGSAACEGGDVGDPCQVDGDCSSGLMCGEVTGAEVEIRATCKTVEAPLDSVTGGTTEVGTGDSGVSM